MEEVTRNLISFEQPLKEVVEGIIKDCASVGVVINNNKAMELVMESMAVELYDKLKTEGFGRYSIVEGFKKSQIVE